jgi:hypothetical protein
MSNLMYTGSTSFVVHPDRVRMYGETEEYVLQLNDIEPVHSIIGMAEGWDEVGAKIAYRHGLPYTCVIPNVGYGRYYWQQHSRTGKNRIAMYNELVNGATNVIYLEEIYGPVIAGRDAGVYGRMAHAPGFMVRNEQGSDYWVMANFLRNQEMVNRADRALVYDAGSPGTAHAVRELKRAHIPYSTYPDFLGTLAF